MAASGYRDYFHVLGVERNASPEEIKRSFRKLARQYHPDVNPGDKNAESRFKEISEAYEVLSDTDKRKRYEQFGKYWNQTGGFAGNTAAGAGFDVDFGRYGNFDDFINDLLGRFSSPRASSGFPGASAFSRPSSNPPINLDAEIEISVRFAEAFHGSERILSVNDERVKVQIPPGIKTNSKLRLKGKGNIQPGTGKRGDLFLKVIVSTHPIWRLDGSQLRADLPVTIDELALGGSVQVLTPDGQANVEIPPGTSPGKSLRLKGKGWPSSNGRGDLFLTLKLEFPGSWSDEEIKVLKRLKQLRCNDPRQSWFVSAQL